KRMMSRLHSHLATGKEVAVALSQDTALSASEKAAVAQRLFNPISWNDPEGALALLPYLPAEDLQRYMTSALSRWRTSNGTAAEAWIASQPAGALRETAEAVWKAQEERAAADPVDDTTPESLAAAISRGESVSSQDARLDKFTAPLLAEAMKNM